MKFFDWQTNSADATNPVQEENGLHINPVKLGKNRKKFIFEKSLN